MAYYLHYTIGKGGRHVESNINNSKRNPCIDHRDDGLIMKDEIHLIFLIDGLGWEVIRDESMFEFPQGIRSPLDTVLGFSSSAIPTILTGKMPEDHGFWNLFYRNEKGTDFPLFNYVSKLDPKISNNKYVRKSLLIANKFVRKFKGYYQAYDFPSEKLSKIAISESNDIYSVGGIGGSNSLIDYLDENFKEEYLKYSYKDGLCDDEIFGAIKFGISKDDPKVVFAYFCEYDAFGHKNATNSSLMKKRAREYASNVEAVVKLCKKKYNHVKLDVFSDHGMVPFEKGVDLFGHLNELWPDWEKSIFSFVDSTMARFYCNEEQGERLKRCLDGFEGRWLAQDELDKYHVDFKGKYGNAFYILSAGSQFVPSHMEKGHCEGMHGYLPEDKNMLASHITNYDVEDSPKHIADLFDHLKRSLLVDAA